MKINKEVIPIILIYFNVCSQLWNYFGHRRDLDIVTIMSRLKAVSDFDKIIKKYSYAYFGLLNIRMISF